MAPPLDTLDLLLGSHGTRYAMLVGCGFFQHIRYVTAGLHHGMVSRREHCHRLNDGVGLAIPDGLPENGMLKWTPWLHRKPCLLCMQLSGTCTEPCHHRSQIPHLKSDTTEGEISAVLHNSLTQCFVYGHVMLITQLLPLHFSAEKPSASFITSGDWWAGQVSSSGMVPKCTNYESFSRNA